MARLVFLLLIPLFAACGSAEMPRQSFVHWRDAGLAFVADNQHGAVRVLYVGASPGSPVPKGELSAEGRTAVLDMRLDPARGRLWVVGERAVYVHDVRTGELVEVVPAPPGVSLRVFAADPSQVIAADGSVWRIVVGHHPGPLDRGDGLREHGRDPPERRSWCRAPGPCGNRADRD
ncbi:MAG: hypothetical protein ACOZB1_03620 [Pseudomonadota bacterium]|jgi:hypothetical protein